MDQDVCVSSHKTNSDPPNTSSQYKTDCIGRAIVKPVMKFAEESYTSPAYPPKLQWFKIYNDDESFGDILAVVELLEVV